MDRNFIITEGQLSRLLEAAIKLSMLEYDGVDNWSWYGESQTRAIQVWYPKTITKEEIEESDIGFWETAQAIIESGRYPEACNG